jgi:O-methyltransferase
MPTESSERRFRATEVEAGAAPGAVNLRSPARDDWVRLDGVAAAIWDAFEYPATMAEAAGALEAAYDAPPREIADAVASFVAELMRAGLVEEAPGSAPDPLRCRYLWLLKRALLNLLYPELELQVRLLARDRPPETGIALKRRLRDLGEERADELARLLAGKRTGNAPIDGPHTMIGLHRLNNIERCAERLFAEGVEGDFLEAGVCQGGATIFMRALQVAHGESHRRTWVVDSFEGVPPSHKEVDRRYPLRLEEARQPWLACSLARVRDNFSRYGLLDAGVEWVPGWVSESLPAAPIGPLALLRIDVDLYSSTAECLDLLYDKLVPGGFLIVDDYGFLECCRDAVDAFRARRAITEPIGRIDYSGICWRKARQ